MSNSDKIKARFKNFSPQKKMDLSMQLYYSARELKKAWLKQNNPEWSDEKLNDEIRKIFLHARS